LVIKFQNITNAIYAADEMQNGGVANKNHQADNNNIIKAKRHCFSTPRAIKIYVTTTAKFLVRKLENN